MDVLKNARRAVKVFQSETVRQVPESLTADVFNVSKTVRHGFPHQPTAMAVDVVQNLLAVGSETGGIRFYGRAGVEHYVEHPSKVKVLFLAFLANEGALISVTSDNTVHMWNLRQKIPAIVHSLNFIEKTSGAQGTSGKITCCYIPLQSTWLYIGTEDGNVYTVVISSFTVSFYVIYWNHVIDTAMKFRPGAVQFLLENPDDNNRMLLVYKHLVVLWDLRSKSVVFQSKCNKVPTGASWFSDGKQFVLATADGELCICSGKDGSKVQTLLEPASGNAADSLVPPTHVHWLSKKEDSLLIYSGGSSVENASRSISVRRSSDTKTLEFPSDVVGVSCLPGNPHSNETQDPHTLLVLCNEGLEVFDLISPSMPHFPLPYCTTLHHSPVTCIRYETDIPPQLIESLEDAGRSQKPAIQGIRRLWPLNGGAQSQFMTDFSDIIITGHADGTVKFWDACQVVMTSLYSLSTTCFFENNGERTSPVKEPSFKRMQSRLSMGSVLSASDIRPVSIQTISFCAESASLIISNGASVITFCQFSAQEKEVALQDLRVSATTPDLTVRRSMSGTMSAPNRHDDASSPGRKSPCLPPKEGAEELDSPVPLSWLQPRRGKFKQHKGFQASLCLSCAPLGDDSPPRAVQYCAMLKLLSVATPSSFLLVDIAQQKLILNKHAGSVTEHVNSIISERKRTTTVSNSSPTTERSWRGPRLPTVRRVAKSGSNLSLGDGIGGASPPVLSKKRGFGLSKRKSSQPDIASPDNENGGSLDDTSPHGDGNRSKKLGLLAEVRRRAANHGHVHEHSEETTADDNGGGEGGNSTTTPTANHTTDPLNDAAELQEELNLLATESVACMQFAITYSVKEEFNVFPSIWMGTSHGNVNFLSLAMPPTPESRAIQDVGWESKAGVLRVSSKGGITTLAILDENGHIPQLPTTPYVDPRAARRRESSATQAPQLTVPADRLRKLSAPSKSSTDVTATPTAPQCHFLVATTDSHAYVYALPSHVRKKQSIKEGTVAVQSVITSVGEGAALCSLMADGHCVIIGLPSLTPLYSVEVCSPPVSPRMVETLSWATGGQALYLANESEIQRLSLVKENILNLPDCFPDLYTVKAFPEQVQKGFFASLMGGNKKLDRDALFGPELGDGNHMVATHVSGYGGLDAVRLKTGEAADVFSRAMIALDERGKKLSVVEQRTAEMAASASGFAQTARALKQQYAGNA